MKNVNDLVAGFRRFQSAYYGERRELVERLARQGQSPKVMVVACSDSRVDPAIVTDCDPGDLFVLRNVANLVPPYEQGGGYHGTSAALEFAVRCLGVEHVIVMGHARCGGLRALLGDIRFEDCRWLMKNAPLRRCSCPRCCGYLRVRLAPRSASAWQPGIFDHRHNVPYKNSGAQ